MGRWLSIQDLEDDKEKMRETKLYVVLPCYNEEEILRETAKTLQNKMKQLLSEGRISADSRIVFVNDGSKDGTWRLIKEFHQADEMFQGIRLAGNKGHQNALLAGLMEVKLLCDVTISMDADMQDDIDAMDEMLDHYDHGCEIVYGVRSSRDTDRFFKRATAEAFYKVLQMLGADIIYNHADYRLMSRKALCALAEYREVNLFLRGMVPMIGYKTAQVSYVRKKRTAGESKYPLRKMMALALEGLTSLSTRPLRLITLLGFFIFAFSIGIGAYSLVRYFAGNTVPGWTSIVLSIWAVGGLVLLSLGIVGEYVGKIYMETKGRPRYLIQEFLGDEGEDIDVR